MGSALAALIQQLTRPLHDQGVAQVAAAPDQQLLVQLAGPSCPSRARLGLGPGDLAEGVVVGLVQAPAEQLQPLGDQRLLDRSAGLLGGLGVAERKATATPSHPWDSPAWGPGSRPGRDRPRAAPRRLGAHLGLPARRPAPSVRTTPRHGPGGSASPSGSGWSAPMGHPRCIPGSLQWWPFWY